MAFVLSIKDGVTAKLGKIRTAFKPEAINKNIGVAMVRMFQEHLSKMPSNRAGWPSQGYWAKAAKSTHYQVVPDGVLVSVSQVGFRMHVLGLPDTIQPVNTNNLTIPAVSQAYGRRAGEFSNLKVAFTRRGGNLVAFALVEGPPTSPKRKGTHSLRIKGVGGRTRGIGRTWQGQVIFWLVKSVKTHPTQGVLPEREEMKAAIVKVMNLEWNKVVKN